MESTKLLPRSFTADCRMLSLASTHRDTAAAVSTANSETLPFAIRRIFFIYDIDTKSRHTGHAHYCEEQAIVAAAGEFDVTVWDGADSATFHLDNPREALYIPAGLWHSLHSFADDAVCLTMSSTDFDETDYIRNPEDFESLRKKSF